MAASLALLLLAPAHARSVKQKKLAARSQFETAERLREALNGKRQDQRSRHDYQKVIDAYRKVYYTAPTVSKADSSVLAVAELLDEQGRVFDDAKSFKDAIGQLEFLRREYPGSKHRAEALFTIAQIYQDDLEDHDHAKAAFEDYLKHYPHGRLAPETHKAIDEMEIAARKDKDQNKDKGGKSKAARAEAKSMEPRVPEPRVKDDVKEAAAEEHHREGHPPLLTNIRHWSTPDYTRVAIDLEDEVKYEAGRVNNPDRIFFDLHGTKLASDLVGKSFDVEDGFLHRIRVAQFKPGLARVVLDVDDVAEYSAFLLPNPYRLIIDIHGKQPAVTVPDAKTSATSRKIVPPKDPPGAMAPPAILTSSIMPPIVPTARPPETTKPKNNAAPEKIVVDKPVEKAGDVVPEKAADKAPDKRDKTDKPVAIAKAEAPKVEEVKIEDKDKVTARPTSGPTYQAVTPHGPSKTRREREREKDLSIHAASPTAAGERSLIRTLGLKIGKIVIDAGHGGHDTGTIGPNGLQEKDLVLDVALKLGKVLEDRLGAEVVYTRDDDTFVPLETRTAIANKERADLFISIHANSSDDASARGVETFYLNFTSSKDALDVAARENAVSEKSIHELQDLVKKIALKEKIEESREFAIDVQKSLYTGLAGKSPGLRDRGVKKAPFIVLIGANMPSILAEISFVSNPPDEKKLKTNDYRQRIAESLYKGVSKYVNGLSGVKVASKLAAE
jgi:N-acetylmuramoyl-L-alanine amidase